MPIKALIMYVNCVNFKSCNRSIFTQSASYTPDNYYINGCNEDR